jgi:hypothetical protein
MEVRVALTSIARRGAVSVVAGLIVSAFAAAALVLGTAGSNDQLAVGRTLWGSFAPVFSAVAGAGFLAGMVVFACLVANDILRAIGPWLVSQRRWLLAVFQAIAWILAWILAQILLVVVAALKYVAESEVFLELVSLARTVGIAVGVLLACAATVAGFVGLNTGLAALGFFGITESTRILVAMLDDPPRAVAMAYAVGGAFALMYIGVGALWLCGWLDYRMTRAGLRYVATGRPRSVAP